MLPLVICTPHNKRFASLRVRATTPRRPYCARVRSITRPRVPLFHAFLRSGKCISIQFIAARRPSVIAAIFIVFRKLIRRVITASAACHALVGTYRCAGAAHAARFILRFPSHLNVNCDSRIKTANETCLSRRQMVFSPRKL